MERPIISFLSDFGARDPSPAICRGVMLDIARDAQIIDITHEVRKWAVRHGAFLLSIALPYLPLGVHLAVVDPGVGTARRPIAIRVGRGDILVGPDNGLLVPAAERLGGIADARALAERSLWSGAPHATAASASPARPTSATFHGRDIFAPVAAHLATGTRFEAVGPPIDPAALVRLPWPGAEVSAGELRTAVLYVDSFGNVKLGAETVDLEAALGVLRHGEQLRATIGRDGLSLDVPWVVTFGDVGPGEPLLFEDPYGRLCLAEREGDLAARLGATDDQPVTIRRR